MASFSLYFAFSFKMKLLTLGSALFLATANTVLAATNALNQANNQYITKPCVFNKWSHCEWGYRQIVEEGHCYCRRPLNDEEVATRRDELCKTYTDQCLTYGKNFDLLQPNGIYCLGIGAYCPKATWDAFCTEAKAKSYRFQCKTRAPTTPAVRFPANFEDLEVEYIDYPDQNGIDETLLDYIYLPDNL